MSDLPQQSRRTLLKLLGGAPLLPLGTLTSGSFLMGHSGQAEAKTINTGARYVSSYFSSMPAPTLSNPAAMATTTVGSAFNVKLNDGTTQTYQLAYRTFFTTGDVVNATNAGTILAGGYFDINNQPIIDRSVAGKERQVFSDCPDGSSLLT